MSRSYRRPWVTEKQKGRVGYWKRQANHKVRRSSDVPNGKAYRKFYNSWNICDWKYRWIWEDDNEYHPYWKILCK